MKHFLLIFILLIQQTAHCAIADVFKDCVLPNQDSKNGGNSDPSSIQNMALPKGLKYTDAVYCDSVCTRGFSSDDFGTGQELNDDIISNCKTVCLDKRANTQKWSYSAGKRISIRKASTQSVSYKDEKGMSHTDTNTMYYSNYPYTKSLNLDFSSSSTQTKAKDCYFSYPLDGKILKIQANGSGNNKIYNCGHNIIVLNPVFPNMFDMSPRTVSGGNVAEINSKVDNSKTLTDILMNNPKYAGVYDFDFDGYVNSFGYNQSDFDDLQTIVQRLFCDIYKQQVISNNTGFDCGAAARNNGFDQSVCNACSAPTDRERYRSKVRTGIMTQSECNNATGNNSDFCNVSRYNLISMDQIRAYNNITTNGRFFVSSYANSTSESAWDNTTMTYHPCFTNSTEAIKNRNLISGLIIQDYYSRSIDFVYTYVCGQRTFLGIKTGDITCDVAHKTQRIAKWNPLTESYDVTRTITPDLKYINYYPLNCDNSPSCLSCPYSDSYGDYCSYKSLYFYVRIPEINWGWYGLKQYLEQFDSYKFWPDVSPSSNDNNNSRNPIIGLDDEPRKVGCFKDWTIYNDRYTDLGINVSDGDYFKINWGGNIIVGNGLTIPFIDQAVAKRIAVGDTSVFEKFSKSNRAQQVRNINFLRILSGLDFYEFGTLYGEDGKIPVRPSNLKPNEGNICNGKTIYDNISGSTPRKPRGLEGYITRSAGSPVGTGGTSNTNTNTFSTSCRDTNLYGDQYQFEGTLVGVGSNKRLKIKHYSPKTPEEQILFANSILNGGYQVRIEKGGCPNDPQKAVLDIAFGNESSDNALNWSTISSDKLYSGNGYVIAPSSITDGGSVTIDNKYSNNNNMLFLRADTPISPPVNIDGVNINIPDGGISVRLTELVDARKNNNAFLDKFDITRQIAITVFTTLIGNPDNITNGKDFDGSVVMIASAFCSSITPIIKALLVLYITLLGIQFMIGTVKINQKELISRLIKISVIMMIFSESSWNWFMQSYIRMCIVGSLQLALAFQNTIYSILSKTDIINDNIFSLFSMWKLFWYIIQQTFTSKLLALVFSSLAGLAIAAIIVMGVIKSFMIIIEGIFVYLSAILTHAVLLTIAPLFLPLTLFKITQDMFQNWTKQVMSFTIIPSAVAISITLYFLLLIIGIDAVMGFSYCKNCWISIFGACLVDSFYILDMSFIPVNGASDFILPMGIVSGALTFIAITNTGQHVVELAVGIISRIIAFQVQTLDKNDMVGVGQASVGSVMKAVGDIKGSVGKDKELKQNRDLGKIGDKLKDFDKDGK